MKTIKRKRMRFKGWANIFICLLSIFAGMTIVLGNKTSFGLFMAVLLFLFFCTLILRLGIEIARRVVLFFIISTIPFPYFIQFAGRDAISITTMTIYFLSAVMIGYLLLTRRRIHINKFEYILPLFMIINITLSLVLNLKFIGQSIRYYTANISGILLYFLIITIVQNKSDTLKIIKIILGALFAQSIICFIQLKIPGLANIFNIFGNRSLVTEAYISYGGYIRAIGTVWNYELLSEWFLIGVLLSIALIYDSGRLKFIIPLFFCLAGLVFTNTRSGILLMPIFMMMAFILVNGFGKDYSRLTFKIVFMVCLGGLLLSLVFSEQIMGLAQRLSTYFSSRNLVTSRAIGREKVWEYSIHAFLSKLTIFGNGLFKADNIYTRATSFHSLYLTIIYRFGICGMLLHILFWGKLLIESFRTLFTERDRCNWYLLLFFFNIIILMLVDGVKIEYFRNGHLIQFAWMMYALCVSLLRKGDVSCEDLVVS